MTNKPQSLIHRYSVFLLVASVCLGLLMIPLIAMKFTDHVSWNLFDFIVMGGMLFASGSSYVFAVRKLSPRRRIYIGIITAITFLWLWAELAVGVFTNWGS